MYKVSPYGMKRSTSMIPPSSTRSLSENWYEYPSEPGTKPARREDVKGMLVKLTSTFQISESRSMTLSRKGTKSPFTRQLRGHKQKDSEVFRQRRKMTMQAIDIQ
jgi:hypothetical protein